MGIPDAAERLAAIVESRMPAAGSHSWSTRLHVTFGEIAA